MLFVFKRFNVFRFSCYVDRYEKLGLNSGVFILVLSLKICRLGWGYFISWLEFIYLRFERNYYV